MPGEYRSKKIKEGESAAKLLRKERLMRKLREAASHGTQGDAILALLEYINDLEVTNAYREGILDRL